MGTKTNPGKFDCYAKAKPDEPIFTLKASDWVAPEIIRRWVELSKHQSIAKRQEALDCAAAMELWRINNAA